MLTAHGTSNFPFLGRVMLLGFPAEFPWLDVRRCVDAVMRWKLPRLEHEVLLEAPNGGMLKAGLYLSSSASTAQAAHAFEQSWT